ncbi:hypothetical protein DW928_10585 [Firmicutes bacterium AM43-11BH]|nr:hypothetical protein DW928_10585 [Firmicutes bacterium AM43-11BH]
MKWTTTNEFSAVNHNPILHIECLLDGRPVGKLISAKPGSLINLSAKNSIDPNGGELEYRYIYYQEAGTYDGVVAVEISADEASITIPQNVAGTEIHIVIEAKNNGVPSMSSYERVILLC